MSEKKKITENHYNLFLTFFKLRGTKKKYDKRQESCLNHLHVSFELKSDWLEVSRQETAFGKFALMTTNHKLPTNTLFFSLPVEHLSSSTAMRILFQNL